MYDSTSVYQSTWSTLRSVYNGIPGYNYAWSTAGNYDFRMYDTDLDQVCVRCRYVLSGVRVPVC